MFNAYLQASFTEQDQLQSSPFNSSESPYLLVSVYHTQLRLHHGNEEQIVDVGQGRTRTQQIAERREEVICIVVA